MWEAGALGTQFPLRNLVKMKRPKKPFHEQYEEGLFSTISERHFFLPVGSELKYFVRVKRRTEV
jgi:hypothetical protein